MNSREIKLLPQLVKASSSPTEYEIFKYLIFEKILPATEAEIPVGLPEDNAVVACVIALEAVPALSVTAIVDFIVSEVFAGTH